jgi:hypothetical protein
MEEASDKENYLKKSSTTSNLDTSRLARTLTIPSQWNAKIFKRKTLVWWFKRIKLTTKPKEKPQICQISIDSHMVSTG